MLKKTIRYEDFNGKPVERICYFHLKMSEFLDMEVSKPGGFEAFMQKAVDEDDRAAMVTTIKDFVLRSYGIMSENGADHLKSKKTRKEFAGSLAFDALLMELVKEPGVFNSFVLGILPKEFRSEVSKAMETAEPEVKNVFEEHAPRDEARLLTHAELIEMDASELKTGLEEGRFKLP